MDSPKPILPYKEGRTLTLSVNQGLEQNESTIEVRIVRLILPSTLSCVMEVESLAASGPVEYPEHSILKLYDWRYATQLRQDNKIDAWTQSHEDAYRDFVENGDAAGFIATLDDDDDGDEIDDELWDTAQNEAYLLAFSRRLHECEGKAYGHLEQLQGKNVPRFFANVHIDTLPTKNPLLQIQGIMIECIEGYSLSNLAKIEPQSAWQSI